MAAIILYTLIFLYYSLRKMTKGMCINDKIWNIFPSQNASSVSLIFLNSKIHLRFALILRTMTSYFPRRIARSLNDIPPSKSTVYDKDTSRKKPIRNISILPSLRHSRAVATLIVLFFFYLTVRRGTVFHAGGQRKIEKWHGTAKHRSSYFPVESGVTVAVPYAACCTALRAWEPDEKFKVGYIFSARQAH